MPAAHKVQFDILVEEAYVPVGQVVQFEAPPIEYDPMVQLRHPVLLVRPVTEL